MHRRVQEKTILIVEDHPVFRQGLESIIQGNRGAGYKIVGGAANAKDAFKLVDNYRPDLVLVDISLPGADDGIVLTGKIMAAYPDTRVLIISMHTKVDYVCEAFKSGARGYLSKDSASEELLPAIKRILLGEQYIDPNLSPAVIETLTKAESTPESSVDSSYSTLSNREQEIFRMLATGEKVVDISKKLGLSPKTVDNHKSNIFKKLGFSKYFDLYQYARRIGVIDPD
jgi:DNA-binding NarL/FixJ family response regulator